MKQWIACITAMITALSLTACGCAKKDAVPEASPSAEATESPAVQDSESAVQPTATPNPKITRTEGYVLPGDEPGVSGAVISLMADSMEVSVAGEVYAFSLGEQVKKDLEYFNKDPQNPRILKGTVVNLYYEETDGKKTATSIEIVESN